MSLLVMAIGNNHPTQGLYYIHLLFIGISNVLVLGSNNIGSHAFYMK